MIEIWLYIAQDNPNAADTLLDRLDRQGARLAENPYLERSRPEIAPNARSWTVGYYLILYRVLGESVEIVRVVQGARDLANLALE